jgi:lipopolysaccharide transport system ATP-binding protein
MPEHVAISARGLGKRYRIWTHARPTSLSDRLEAVAAALHHRARRTPEAQPLRKEIWALKDVSFDVHRGEVLGVIGPNGAGKSTLLSILARVTEPTTGSAEIHGRVSSLLEVGTGFHPELSGRDNVFLNGAILGMSRRETREKFDEIVDFSGVRDFIDMPVKRYSSGMYMRLAFAVAAHLDPEVLLLDEVLSVGDSSFQQKSLRRIDELTKAGRTVLFVSHTPSAVAQLCHRAIVINEGRVVYQGAVEEAIDRYLDSVPLDGGPSATDQTASRRDGTGEVRVTEARVTGDDGGRVLPDRAVRIEVDLVASTPMRGDGVAVEVGLWGTSTGQPVTLSTKFEPHDPLAGLGLGAPATLVCELEELPLRPGRYFVAVSVERLGHIADACRTQAEFIVHPSDYYNTGVAPLENHPSAVLIRHRWRAAARATVEEVASG